MSSHGSQDCTNQMKVRSFWLLAKHTLPLSFSKSSVAVAHKMEASTPSHAEKGKKGNYRFTAFFVCKSEP